MTDPGPDPGVRTYLTGAPARAGVRADMRPHFRGAPAVDLSQIPVHAASFVLDDYTVVHGWPTGRPDNEVRNFTRVGLGDWTFSDRPPQPFEINIGAAVRWLPTDSSFVPGTMWTPTTGGGLNWVFDPEYAPTLYDDYSFQVIGGDEVSLPAMVFSGDAWARLDDPGWSSSAFTFVLAAVMMPNLDGDTYGVLESSTLNGPAPVDPNNADPLPYAPNDWGLRYTRGQIYFWAGANMLRHRVSFPQARVVIMGIALDSSEGKFIAASSGALTTDSFDSGGLNVFDLDLFLGRTGEAFDAANSAQMAVFDLSFFDHALSFTELADVVHSLNAVYGVMR